MKSIVRKYVSSILSENGIESELVDVELYGSRGRGTARKDSDLDAVVEYRGDIREDGMFNLLNAEDSRLVIDGITVDVNPIRAEETGTMASYMERSRRYDAEMTGQPAFRTVAITPEVRNEMDEIIDKAKKDGTYLKAPNGKDTKLSPEQWVMVRTEQFKKWFGDWEKVMRIEKLRKSRSASITGNEIVLGKDYSETRKNALAYGKSLRGEYTNKDTGNKFLLVAGKNGGIKEILEHDYKDMPHLLSIAAIPQIAEESIYIDSVNNEDLKKHPDIVRYDYYVCGLTIGKEEYTVKAAIAVTKDGQKYYDHKLTEIEKGKLIDELANINLSQSGLSSVATSGESNVNYPAVNGKDITGSPISGIKDKRLVSILQTNSSKVVDENGEPMVVYHGTGIGFNIFDRRKTGDANEFNAYMDGFYFTDSEEFARKYSNPFFSDNEDKLREQVASVFLEDNPEMEESELNRRIDEINDWGMNGFPEQDKDGKWMEDALQKALDRYWGNRRVMPVFLDIKNPVMGSALGIDMMGRAQDYDGIIDDRFPENHSYLLERAGVKEARQFVVRNPEQVKSATDNNGEYSNDNTDVRFRAVPVEGNKNLVAIHNLKEQDLRNAFELGGFPMPSIAITKTDVGHTAYGEISLVLDKTTINPSNKKNKVCSGYAWTPMFPKIEYKINADKAGKIYGRAAKVGTLPMFEPTNFHRVNYEDKIDGLGSKSVIEQFRDDYGTKQFFLAEQGNPVTEYKTATVERYNDRDVARFKELIDKIGIEKLKEDVLDVSEETRNVVKGFTKFGKNEESLKRIATLYAMRAVDYVENGNKKEETDYAATHKEIDSRIDRAAYEQWLEDLFSGIVEKRGIRNERDMYTPSGNRRAWESLYDEITLDNVVKAMSKAPEKGGSGFFHGNIFGAASGAFGSLAQIREAAKQRIGSIEPSEMEKYKNAILDRLSNVKVTDKELDISEMFDLTSNIQDAVAKTHTPEGIYKYLKEFYPDTTLEAAQKISDIVKDIQQLSTRYFEAKPYRAVGFDEVKLAVVPEGTSQDIFDGLRERGVDVRTYTDGDQEQRKQVVADTAKETGLNFRINADERKYANENIDKAIAFVRGISVKEASDMRKDDERRIKEKTTELYSKVLDNQFDDITLQLIDEFIANVTPNNPYRQPLSKRLPPSVGRRMRGVERNNAVDGLFTRIAESTVREAGSSVERTRARREAEEKKKELLKGWAIATGNWHTSVSDFTDNTEPIGKGKDSVVYNSNDGNNVIKVSFGKNKEKKFSPDIDAVNLFNAVFPNTRYEILGYGEIDGKFVKFLKQPSVRFSENPTVSVEDRIDYMRNLGFEPINKEKSAFSNGELVVADVQKGNIVRDVNGKIRVIDADVKLHTKDIGGNYTYPPASDDILPQSGGISFRTANENQQVFISNTLASLDKIPMKSGNAQAWINKLQQAGGLKKEEDKWIGLTDWLKELDGNISKADVAEYIREHQVRIEDVNYGESVVFVKDRLAKKYGDIVNEAFQIDEEYGEENIYVKDLDKAIEFYNSQNTITPILDSLYMDEDGEVDQRAMEDTLIEWMSGIASEVASENENKEIDPIRLQYRKRPAQHI